MVRFDVEKYILLHVKIMFSRLEAFMGDGRKREEGNLSIRSEQKHNKGNPLHSVVVMVTY